MSGKPKIVTVVGPTASGKSTIGIEIAKAFDGEVISSDSRQVFRALDIGTAKLTGDEMRGIPHHLIDIIGIEESYSAADFVRDAQPLISEISARKKLPIIAGGTFFYINALLGRISTPAVPPNPELRSYLEDFSPDTLYRQLEELDPERAFTIDQHNKRRLVRALEIIHAVGKVPERKVLECPYDTLMIGITASREELRTRYEMRARDWLSRGFRTEVENLLSRGVTRDRLHEIGFEYQLMLLHIDGSLTEEAFVQRFIEKNWQYAKRQMTWLKRDESIEWFPYEDLARILKRVESFLD